MKLKELIDEILSSGELGNKKGYLVNVKGLTDTTIYGEELEPYIDRIKQCEEFSECDEIVIMKHPVTLDENKKTIQSLTYKVGPNQKFKGKCYLLSLALTPEMYDPKKIHEPVLDGACITPTMYDPTTFEPKKKIVLEFSPEALQDDINSTEEVKRKQLHETLDKILDNPESYQVKGEKGVLVRGLFEEVVTPTSTYKTDLIGINPEKQTHGMVFFLEEDKEKSKGDEVSLKLTNMLIPIELKDKYLEELGPKSIQVTREEIEKFLEDNK
jgi:hypothetical protein